MKKLLLSLFLMFPLTRCGPNCGTGKVRPYYDLQEVNVVTAHVVRVTSPSGSSSLIFPDLAAGRPVLPDSLALRVDGTVTYHASIREPFGRSAWEAYACSPAPDGFEGSKESVKELTVRSEQDFDATHPAGSSLNEYFEYINTDDYTVDVVRRESVAEYTRRLPLMPPRHFVLRLRMAPAQKAGSYTFTVHYELTNGEVYTARIDNITFR
ncbi:MAG: hypothetical protein ICV83_09165 [Cytophagales bacterium]|nr:hypothetical protein [Cytophagales bacterium]